MPRFASICDNPLIINQFTGLTHRLWNRLSTASVESGWSGIKGYSMEKTPKYIFLSTACPVKAFYSISYDLR